MPAEAIQGAFVAYWAVKMCAPLLALGVGLLTRRQLGVSGPLWIAAAMVLRWIPWFLHPGWTTKLVDRFMTDTPPIPVSVGTAVTLISLGSDLLYSVALLVLFATAIAELVESTRTRVDWGGGRFVSGLVLFLPRRGPLCAFALALAAVGSLGPGIALLLLTD